MNGGGALVELLNELINATPTVNDSIVKRATAWQLTVCRGAKRVPEELMIEMAATVEPDIRRESNCLLELACCIELSLLLQKIVQVVHIGSVVLTVMEVKQVARDDGLEGTNLIGQVLQPHTLGSGPTAEVSTHQIGEHGSCKSLIS